MESLLREIQAQGVLVRELKKAVPATPKPVLDEAIEKLKTLKIELKKYTDLDEAERKEKQKFRASLEDLLVRKFFYVPSFEIYGGVGGLYDYGPPGCAVMSNLQSFWRKHFVLTENMLEVSCSSMTPEIVLKTSGHVDRFTDYMVHDTVTKDYYRADKLLEEIAETLLQTEKAKTDESYAKELSVILAKAGSMNGQELHESLTKYEAKSPDGNPISEPASFNLMFKTSIGPTGKFVGYLRPETAQGIFVNFRRLYEYNNRKLPFGAAQIGLAYRNEIAPRSGLLRVREFPLAEIEHFVNPDNKQHTRFSDVADYKLGLLPRSAQDGVNQIITKSAKEAVDEKIIDNETLAYFMVRTHMFLVACGVDPTKLRFRQHLHTEMAHYATDCWDAEILTSYGWIECVGHADRSAYDLKVHTESSKVDLSASEALEVPVTVKKFVPKPNMGKIGRSFRKQASEIFDQLNASSQEQLTAIKEALATNGQYTFNISTGEAVIPASDLTIEEIEEKISAKSYLPSVIEPSFGLGRIIYGILEHAYYVRPDDEQRKVLRLSSLIAPIKVGIYNVVSNINYQRVMNEIRVLCIEAGITFQEDVSKTSIGRKYARGDEVGTPYAISIDSESCDETKNLVALRERDSLQQVQVPFTTAVEVVDKLCRGRITWEEVYSTYPKFNIDENQD